MQLQLSWVLKQYIFDTQQCIWGKDKHFLIIYHEESEKKNLKQETKIQYKLKHTQHCPSSLGNLIHLSYIKLKCYRILGKNEKSSIDRVALQKGHYTMFSTLVK